MVVYPIFGFLPANPKSMNKGKKDLVEALKVLENHLRSRSFVVGNTVTLADIVLTSALVYVVFSLKCELDCDVDSNTNARTQVPHENGFRCQTT